MKKTWKIYDDKHDGVVTYNSNEQTVKVEFPNKNKRIAVLRYLTTPRVFRVSTGQEVDQFDEVVVSASVSVEKMQLALSGLFGNCDVKVHWD